MEGNYGLDGIFKEPVAGPVMVRRDNLDGDRQADLTVHGGPNKAVYGYASEHYPYWRKQYPQMELSWGVFGENLTTEGVSEDSLHIGDTVRVGSAVLRVVQPRQPCYKLQNPVRPGRHYSTLSGERAQRVYFSKRGRGRTRGRLGHRDSEPG